MDMHIYEFYHNRDQEPAKFHMESARVQTSIGVITDMFNQKIQKQNGGGADSKDIVPLILHFLNQAPFNPDGSKIFNKNMWNMFVHAVVHKRQDEQNEIVWNGIKFFMMGFDLGLWAAPDKSDFTLESDDTDCEDQPWYQVNAYQQNFKKIDEIAFIPLYSATTPIFFDQRMDLNKLWTIPADQLPLYVTLLRGSTSQNSKAEIFLKDEDVELLKPLVQRSLVKIYAMTAAPEGGKKVKYDCVLTGPNTSPLVPIPSYQLSLPKTNPTEIEDIATETPPSIIVF